MPAAALAAPPTPVTDLRVQHSGTSAVLTWTHTDATIHHYEVWWSDSPYAAIGDAGMVMIATVTPGAAPSEATYTDTASGVGNISVNSFYAVRGVTAGGEASALSNQTGEFDFGLNGVQPALPVVDHCGTISADEVWGPNAVHRLTCSVTVDSAAKLTIVAGTKIQASSSVALSIYGNLIAQGSREHPITFTNLTGDETSEKWQGIYVSGGTVVISGAVVANAETGVLLDSGSLHLSNSTVTGSADYGLRVSRDASQVALSGVTFSNNGGYPIYIDAPAVGLTQLSNVTLADNLYDAILVGGSILSGSHTWPAWPVDYEVHASGIDIASGASLALPAGITIRFSDGVGIFVEGTLIAQGTADAPIVFTLNTSKPYSPFWYGLSFAADSSGALEHVIVENSICWGGSICGGVNISGGNVTITDSIIRNNYQGVQLSSGTVNVTNSTIRDNDLGISVTDGTVNITNSTIRDNNYQGINVTGGSATIHYNNIYGNSDCGVCGISSVVVGAEYNWWGSDSGPAPYGSGNGINYQTCWDSLRQVNYICQYYVDADPWLGKEVAAGAQLGNSGPTSSQQAFVADPVNTANGNYAHQHTDIAIPTRGLPLDFTRAYNSLNPTSGPLGDGWTHNWNLRLTENTTDGAVTIAFGDGHTERWTWTGGAYDGGPGVFGLVVKNGDGSFDLTQKDQARYHFASGGRLAWVEDKNANRTTLVYDGSGRLLTITEPAGRALTLEYTSPVSTTLISRITDHVSRSVLYTYDSASNLVTVTDVTGQATSMTYDADHRLLTMTDANGHTFLTNVYDTNHRVTEQYDALSNKWTFAYDEPGHKTLVTDPRATITTYEYDGDWRLIGERDALGYTASYAYDADNNRTRITDKRGNPTHYAYDGRGNTTVITDTLGFTRTFSYDTTGGRNNLLSERDPLGRITTYAYDAHSNLTQRTDALSGVTTWAYNAYGQVTSTADANGHMTGYGYHAYGNRTSTTDALSHSTTATYDSAGRKLTETNPLGRVTTYTYDAANRVLSISEPLGKTTAYTYDAVGNRITVTENGIRNTQYAYDAKNRLTSVTDPPGHTTAYGYDTVDNQVSVTDPLGHTTTTTYDALNRRTSVKDALNNTTSYEYDPNGNRTKVTDANDRATVYTYDAMNRLTGVTDATGGAVSYAYDAAGNRTSITDANVHTTTYAYDALNRLISATDPLGHVTGYGYDAVGNRTSETRPDGAVVSYTFDAVNWPTGVSYPGGSISYSYDAAGNRTSMTDTAGLTTYTYDTLDRVTQIAGPNGTLGYGYDLFNDRTSVTYPGGSTITYAYDLANRLTGITDHASRFTQYIYDDANRLTTITYPNGVQATYTHDDADRLLSIIHSHPTHGQITSASYTLDAVGNRLSMTDPDGTTSYTYDSLYRLTQVAYPDSEQVTYAYDPMGNRTSLTNSVHGTTTYSYDAADRLLSYTEPGGTVTLAWDDNGRMTGKGSATYTYDPLDRLTQVVSGTTTIQFAYDGDGARLRKTVELLRNKLSGGLLQSMVGGTQPATFADFRRSTEI